jgi:cytochrome c-type biogenesis protein CcmH/NrfF
MTRVASRFVCSCGTCGEERLDVCTCETAQAERAFIQDQLRNGRSETEAAEALKQKYGGLKA